MKKRTTVWLPDTLLERLKKLSRKTGAPMAELFRQLARKRKAAVRKLLPTGKTFRELVALFRKNKPSWPASPDQALIIERLETEVVRLETEFPEACKTGDPNQLDELYREKLGYLILNHLGGDAIKTLLSA